MKWHTISGEHFLPKSINGKNAGTKKARRGPGKKYSTKAKHRETKVTKLNMLLENQIFTWNPKQNNQTFNL